MFFHFSLFNKKLNLANLINLQLPLRKATFKETTIYTIGDYVGFRLLIFSQILADFIFILYYKKKRL